MSRIKDHHPKHHRNRHISHKPKKVNRTDFEKVYWPYIPAIILLIGIGLLTSFSQQFVSHKSTAVLGYATGVSTNLLLQDTNIERNSLSIESLKLNDQLTAAAQAKANDMVKRDYWSHYTPDGYAPWMFVTAAGYNYQKVGENLAAGFSNTDSTVAGWMASPTHRANMLDTGYTEVGFGFANSPNFTATSSKSSTVVVAFYGRPAGLLTGATKDTSCSDQSDKGVCSTPTTSTTTQVKGESSTVPVSKLQTIFSNTPLAISGGLAIIFLWIFIAVWVSHHGYRLKKAIAKGERYALRYPALDAAFVIVFVVGYLLAQTAGIIR